MAVSLAQQNAADASLQAKRSIMLINAAAKPHIGRCWTRSPQLQTATAVGRQAIPDMQAGAAARRHIASASDDGGMLRQKPAPHNPQQVKQHHRRRRLQAAESMQQREPLKRTQPACSTAEQWLRHAAVARTSPRHLCDVLRALAGVQQPGGVQNSPEVLQVCDAVMQIMDKRGSSGRQLATFADALGTALDAQPAALKALRSNAQHTERLVAVLGACAAASDTFSDARCTSQVATAQRKLGVYCDAFWEQLERRGLRSLPARELATVVYCRASLVHDEVAPAPTDTLWGMMQRAIQHEARRMSAQGLANVFLACAYVGEAPAADARTALSGALRSKQSDIVAQNIANIVWATGRLHMRLDRTEKHLLMQQLQQHSSRFNAQDVSNAWLGLAHLGLQPGAHLAAELQDAVAHVAGAMNGQAVANTLWAFAKLKLQTSDHAVEVLPQRCLTVSSGMSAQEVSNALYAIAKVQLDVDSKLQTALLHRAEQVAPEMPPQDVANSLWALAEADITPGHELNAALLARAERISKRFEPVDVVQVLNGAARLGLQPIESQRRAITTAHKRLVGRMNAIEESIAQRALQQLGCDK